MHITTKYAVKRDIADPSYLLPIPVRFASTICTSADKERWTVYHQIQIPFLGHTAEWMNLLSNLIVKYVAKL